jgi:hypothetical protein
MEELELKLSAYQSGALVLQQGELVSVTCVCFNQKKEVFFLRGLRTMLTSRCLKNPNSHSRTWFSSKMRRHQVAQRQAAAREGDRHSFCSGHGSPCVGRAGENGKRRCRVALCTSPLISQMTSSY